MMSEWQDISTAPGKPMPVIFWCANEGLADGYPPYREDRVEFGFWDGARWGWAFTGHLVFDRDHEIGDPEMPTHWMPLPAPPTGDTK